MAGCSKGLWDFVGDLSLFLDEIDKKHSEKDKYLSRLEEKYKINRPKRERENLPITSTQDQAEINEKPAKKDYTIGLCFGAVDRFMDYLCERLIRFVEFIALIYTHAGESSTSRRNFGTPSGKHTKNTTNYSLYGKLSAAVFPHYHQLTNLTLTPQPALNLPHTTNQHNTTPSLRNACYVERMNYQLLDYFSGYVLI
eukprot:268780-Amorphochlora_amoeboformis.AAC.2